jgi:hypothetical protein
MFESFCLLKLDYSLYRVLTAGVYAVGRTNVVIGSLAVWGWLSIDRETKTAARARKLHTVGPTEE